MKAIALILIAILLGVSSAQAQWTVKSYSRNGGIRSLTFPDPRTGYVISLDTILKTTDGGESWTRHPLPAGQPLKQIVFSDSLVGYGLGTNGGVYKTTNGALTWNALVDTTVQLNAFHFYDRLHGFAVGDGSVVVSTTDGGVTWSSSILDTAYDLNAIHAPAGNVAYVSGNRRRHNGTYYGMVFKTVDGGRTWRPLVPTDSSAPFTEVTSIYFISADSGFVGIREIPFATELSPTILRTTDGGKSWEGLANASGEAETFGFLNSTTGAFGAFNRVVGTTDGGEHWERRVLLPDYMTREGRRYTDVRSVVFINDSVAFCAARSELEGYLLKLEFGANASGVADHNAGAPGLDVRIDAGDDALLIDVGGANAGQMLLNLVDIRGVSILSADIPLQRRGSVWEVALPPLPRGAYVVQLTVDGARTTKKMLLGSW